MSKKESLLERPRFYKILERPRFYNIQRKMQYSNQKSKFIDSLCFLVRNELRCDVMCYHTKGFKRVLPIQ